MRYTGEGLRVYREYHYVRNVNPNAKTLQSRACRTHLHWRVSGGRRVPVEGGRTRELSLSPRGQPEVVGVESCWRPRLQVGLWGQGLPRQRREPVREPIRISACVYGDAEVLVSDVVRILTRTPGRSRVDISSGPTLLLQHLLLGRACCQVKFREVWGETDPHLRGLVVVAVLQQPARAPRSSAAEQIGCGRRPAVQTAPMTCRTGPHGPGRLPMLATPSVNLFGTPCLS